MKIIYACITTLFLASCAPSKVWVNPNKSESDFHFDKNQCVTESNSSVTRQIVPQNNATISNSNTNCTKYGNNVNCSTYTTNSQDPSAGLAQSMADLGTAIAKTDYFNSCMRSKGWQLTNIEEHKKAISNVNGTNKNKPQLYKEGNEKFRMEMEAICRNVKYKPFFDKTSCSAKNISIAQMSDPYKVNEEEKKAIQQLDEEFIKTNQFTLDLINQTIEPISFSMELHTITRKVQQDAQQLRLKLYNSEITWGEFNTSRAKVAQEFQDNYISTFKKYTSPR